MSQPVVIRSEERVVTDVVVRSWATARLRKVVVVEQQTIVVPVRREELVLETIEAPASPADTPAEAADDPAEAGGAPVLREDGEVVYETVLSREEVVVRTVVVPVERARVRIEVTEGEQAVSAEVRREQVELTEERW